MFLIEVVSHVARVLSLTVRLYANMFAGDLVTLAFFSLVPIGVPLIFLSLHLGVSIDSDLCVHAAGDDLPEPCCFARTLECTLLLEQSLTCRGQPSPRTGYHPREREGVSTVNLNHPLARYFRRQEQDR